MVNPESVKCSCEVWGHELKPAGVWFFFFFQPSWVQVMRKLVPTRFSPSKAPSFSKQERDTGVRELKMFAKEWLLRIDQESQSVELEWLHDCRSRKNRLFFKVLGLMNWRSARIWQMSWVKEAAHWPLGYLEIEMYVLSYWWQGSQSYHWSGWMRWSRGTSNWRWRGQRPKRLSVGVTWVMLNSHRMQTKPRARSSGLISEGECPRGW